VFVKEKEDKMGCTPSVRIKKLLQCIVHPVILWPDFENPHSHGFECVVQNWRVRGQLFWEHFPCASRKSA
jgi:hypothetical protein